MFGALLRTGLYCNHADLNLEGDDWQMIGFDEWLLVSAFALPIIVLPEVLKAKRRGMLPDIVIRREADQPNASNHERLTQTCDNERRRKQKAPAT